MRTTGLNMSPAPNLNPYRQLVCAQTEDVDTVVIDGRILKRGGKLTAVDADEVVRAVPPTRSRCCGRKPAGRLRRHDVCLTGGPTCPAP